jgi:hypothetical protein
MAKYFAFHKLKKSAEEVTNALSQGAVQMAQTMASGQTPSKCLKTWTPLTHGRDDYLFCLWEADKIEDVEATIKSFGFLEYFTVDTMQVDEIDWGELAKAGS